MKIINVRINTNKMLVGIESAELLTKLKTLGIGYIHNAYEFKKLAELLEEFKNEDVLIFSNFPPNSSYHESLSYGNKATGTNAWHADSYSLSTEKYEAISKRFIIKAIHFITGAPYDMVNETMLKPIFPNTKITVKRHNSFVDSKIGYEKSYRLYIEGCVKDSL